jgi:hypothetical protein
MDDYLTNLQAFECMKCFLERYYFRTKSDDIGSLLGDLQNLGDEPADIATWQEWLKCIDSIVNIDQNNNTNH